MTETNRVIPAIMLAITKARGRLTILFRNNVAQAVVGRAVWIRHEQAVTVRPGDCIVRSARVLHAGLVKGSSDLVGWDEVVVTPEMVGSTVAVFTVIEAKDKGGRLEPEQRNFLDRVKAAGGKAGVASGPDDALAIISDTGRSDKGSQ
jgi:hypothetical protein